MWSHHRTRVQEKYIIFSISDNASWNQEPMYYDQAPHGQKKVTGTKFPESIHHYSHLQAPIIEQHECHINIQSTLSSVLQALIIKHHENNSH